MRTNVAKILKIALGLGALAVLAGCTALSGPAAATPTPTLTPYPVKPSFITNSPVPSGGALVTPTANVNVTLPQ
jgi:hypothetical protein